MILALLLVGVQGLFDKEPEIIRWIDQFLQGDTLLDVGANIGLYSLYASKSGCNVVSIEPDFQIMLF